MVMDVDVGLQSAMEEVQRVLNTLPHGEAKKLVDPIDRLYNEATWLQSQRDRARLLDPNRTPQGYWLLFSADEKDLNYPGTYQISLPKEESSLKVETAVQKLVHELNEELSTKLSVQVFKLSYSSKADSSFDDRDELKSYLREAMTSLSS